MARPAEANEEEALIAALDARLKALFDVVQARPVPAKLRRHLAALDAAGQKPKR
jgi:hypothetical protein